MKTLMLLAVVFAALAGCSGASKTVVDPSESRVRSTTTEVRPLDITRITATTAPALPAAPAQPETYSYRLRIQGALPCAAPPSSSSSPPASDSPSPNPP